MVTFSKFILFSIIFLHKVTKQHHIPPTHPCLSALTCNHTGEALCGVEEELDSRMFLDECDMFEYNCGNHKAYFRTNLTQCSNSTTEKNNTSSTPTTVTVNIPSSTLNQSISRTTIITQNTTTEIATASYSTNFKSCTCTTPPSKITLNDIKNTTEVTSTTTDLSYTSTTSSNNVTSSRISTSDINVTTSFIEVNNNTIPNEKDTLTTMLSCDKYPKECDRPHTWETTVKGETRDFYRILKARFGNRVKVLRDTTHWPRRKIVEINDEENFEFGRHNEEERFV